MYGWIRQLLGKQKLSGKPKHQSSPSRPELELGSSSDSLGLCSSCTSSGSHSTSVASCSCSSSSTSSLHRLPPALSSAFRRSREYDVCVCHSAEDDREAERLVSYLEAPSQGLRCFLPHRDCALGGAVPTELYRALQSSHCWVLLVTQNFVGDEWCLYQMHQALSEGPMSNRIIPMVLHLPSQYPEELRFFYRIDLGRDQERGYTQLHGAVLRYLGDMIKKEKDSNVSDSVSANKGQVENVNSSGEQLNSNTDLSEPQLLNIGELVSTTGELTISVPEAPRGTDLK